MEAALSFSLFLLLASLFFSIFAGQMLSLRLQKALDGLGENVSEWSSLLSFTDLSSGTLLGDLVEGGAIGGALSGDREDLAALLSGEADIKEELKLFLLEKGSALIWQEAVKLILIEQVGRDYLEASCLEGGVGGLSLADSSLRDRDLDLVLCFRVRSFFSWPLAVSYPVTLRSCRRLWIGTASLQSLLPEEEAEETVFVTLKGKVYHRTLECRSLSVHPHRITAAQLATERNNSGGKYYPCESCCGGRAVKQGDLYVTDDGTRYHVRIDCSKLVRNIREIPLSEAAADYRPCAYCGGE